MPHVHKHSRILKSTVVALAAVCLLGVACTGGSSGPRQGTPEWYLQAASDNFAIPDYGKTVEQLKDAMKAEGEAGQNAMLWRAVLTAGLARGYDDLADAFVEGIEANEARTEDFQNSINDYRRRTRVNAIEFSESVGKIRQLMDAQGDAIAFDFPIPSGNGSVSPILGSVKAGNKVDAQVTAMEDQTLERGIFSVLSELTGGTEFSKLASDAAAGGITAAPDAMEFGIARILLDVSIMFNREGINDPRVRKFVLDMAEKWAEPHLENDELGKRLDDFKFDVENEHRDLAGKRRMKRQDS